MKDKDEQLSRAIAHQLERVEARIDELENTILDGLQPEMRAKLAIKYLTVWIRLMFLKIQSEPIEPDLAAREIDAAVGPRLYVDASKNVGRILEESESEEA